MPNSPNLPMEFNFSKQTQPVTVQLINNEPYFLAKDVCDSLGLENVTKALYSLDEDEKLTLPVVRSGQTREMNFVNESGLYNLIFQSRKPEAKKFRKWVTNEVLPSIRKTGSYGKQRSVVPSLFNANEINDLLQYVENRVHEGETYYAAIQLRKYFGMQRTGSVDILLKKLSEEGEAIKLPPNEPNAKWWVKRSSVHLILGIKPSNLLNISIIKAIKGGA